jgi:hypothetical protein
MTTSSHRISLLLIDRILDPINRATTHAICIDIAHDDLFADLFNAIESAIIRSTYALRGNRT